MLERWNYAAALALLISLSAAHAFRGATVPWTTYEAEAMTSNGTILGPPPRAVDKNQTVTNTVAGEASGRQCVQLSAAGQFVEFVAQAAANTMVVRYSVPDTADGVGADYTISLYLNGAFTRKVSVTSRLSWLYGGYTFSNNPGDGSPRDFFDEARLLNLSINAGDHVRLQKDGDDAASYYVIDLVDLENVSPALTQPAGSRSVLTNGAVGNGVHDDTIAISNCVAAGGVIWFPPGNYLVSGDINVSGGTTIQGAGMWYTTFVGDPAKYVNERGRVRFNGAGSNLHFNDFAILGRLNLRNDSQANDGFSEIFGTNSSISRVWVEHTKTGAWLANASGMVISDCRIRNTIADGINLSVGMNRTIVTNCTTRNTGDDSFAIWPATYRTPTYEAGYNVITHCTAQSPFFANCNGIYGGISNRVEDCLFQDAPDGCGILIAGTFPIGTNSFRGVTCAQRCDLVRCGGNDPGWRWRGALTLCPDSQTISGLNVNNLNISNSLSYAVQILHNTLANASMSDVNVRTYAAGVPPYHPQDPYPYHTNYCDGVFGVLADNSANGSISVSNLFINGTNLIAVQTNAYQTDCVDKSGGFTFNFLNTAAQYYLTMNASAGGGVSPASGWFNPASTVTLTATPASGYTFTNWTGSGSGAYSGTSNPISIIINGPISETANFFNPLATNVNVLVQANPTGHSFLVDGVAFTNSQNFTWLQGSAHTLTATSPQNTNGGVQDAWISWSDGGALAHTISPIAATNYTANFATQYYLTMNASAGGSASPASGWFNTNSMVMLSATPNVGSTFTNWIGSGSGSYSGASNPASITMRGPIFETASFSNPPLPANAYTATNSGAWNTASTWTPNGVPGVSDIAIIPAGKTVTYSGTPATIGRILISGTFSPSASGTLGDVSVDINGNFDVTSSGANLVFNGSVTNYGQMPIAALGSATVYTYSGVGKFLAGNISNVIANITGSYENVGTFVTGLKGTQNAFKGAGSFTNSGVLMLAGGQNTTPTLGTLDCSPIGNLVVWTNFNGVAVLETATYYDVIIGQQGSSAWNLSNVTINHDLTLTMNAPISAWPAGNSIGGKLTYSCASGTSSTFPAAFSVGAFNQTAGRISISAGGTLTVTGTGPGVWTQTGGALTAGTSATVKFTGSAPDIAGAAVNNLFLDSSATNATASTPFFITNSLTVAADAFLDVTGLPASTYTLSGTESLLSSGAIKGSLAAVSGSKIFAAGDGTYGAGTVTGNLTLAAGSTVNLDVNSTAAATNDRVVVQGALMLNSNTFNLKAPGAGASIDVANDYTLVTAGSISGTPVMHWVTAPADTNYTLVISSTSIKLHHGGSIVVGRPTLNYSFNGGLLTFSWDMAGFPGFNLQKQSVLGSAWGGVSNGKVSPVIIQIDPAASASFFRLSNH